MKVAVIGAGVSGSAAARVLHQAGIDVVIYEKGRGPGGRAATRRTESVTFDHGAQYFTARESAFQEQVARWQTAGVVQPWSTRLVSIAASGVVTPLPEEPRYVGVPGMNAICRDLIGEVRLEASKRVVSVGHTNGGWFLSFEQGEDAGPFCGIIVTAPVTQAIQLIEHVAGDLPHALAAVSMLPCWTVMCAFGGRVSCGFDGAVFDGPGPLGWIARNSSKPGRSAGEAWVLQATRRWSSEFLEADRASIERCLLEALQSVVDRPLPEVTFSAAHRWRYAFADQVLGQLSVTDESGTLACCGDWCLGPRVECAYLSGQDAAGCVVATLARGSRRPAS